MTRQGYRELRVWQRSMDLMLEAYRLAGRLPPHEAYGITSQLRRSAISVPLNISEGAGRLHRGDFLRFLSIARGSLKEVDTCIEAARRLAYLAPDETICIDEHIDHVSRMLTRLIARMRG